MAGNDPLDTLQAEPPSAGDDKSQRSDDRSLRSDMLRRGLVCVSLAADSVDAQLDRHLDGLRALLRRAYDNDELQQQIDTIEKTVRHLDQRRRQAQSDRYQQLQELAALLLQLQPERAQRKALEKLTKELALAMPPDFGQALTALVALAQQLMVLPDPVASGSGFFSRLWHRAPVRDVASDDSPDDKSAQANATAPDASAATHKNTISNNSSLDRYESSAIRERIAGMLTALLDQNISEPRDKREEQVREQLNSGFDWKGFPALLSETLAIAGAGQRAQHQQMENFLRTLDSRLGDVQQFMLRNRGNQDDADAARDRFDHALRDNIATLNAEIHGDAPGVSLVQKIADRLGVLTQVIDSFQSQEQVRSQSIQQELQQLSERVAGMEKQSAHMRDAVRKARAQAVRDALTGLPNRQALIERMALEWARREREGKPLSVVFMDIDFFKKVNDGYGHAAGDKVLKLVARALAEGLRKTDFIARYGGEEFVLLLPDTAMDGALQLADKVRLQVAGTPFHFSGQPVAITVSAGVAEIGAADTADSAYARADAALYQAKHDGRNCIRAAAS